jgi:hypothetical protein
MSGELAAEVPDGGMIFTSYGNYGSRLYDMEGDKFLRLVICDECVRAAALAGLVLQGRPQPTPDPVLTVWRAPQVAGTDARFE